MNGMSCQIISESGVASDFNKVQEVHEWPTPTSLQDVRRFVGPASYYRRFVKDFASIAEPLHVLTKKQAQFSWSEECQAAFNELKSLLTTAPILGDPLEARQHDTGHRPPVTSASALLSRRFSRVWNVCSPMEAASCPQMNRITAPHGEDC